MINNRDIQENGKLICEFLELKIRDKRAKSNPVYVIPFSTVSRLEYYLCGGEPTIEIDTDIRASETLFHSDWNWIMEVVDKIGTLGTYNVFTTKHGTDIWNTNSDDYVVRVRGAFGKFYLKDFNHGKENDMDKKNLTRIETTYKAVIEFIKWHNAKNL